MVLKAPIEQKIVQLPYADDPGIRETYADQSRLTHFSNHAVHVELVVIRPKLVADNKVEDCFLPSARLVLSMQAAMNLHQQLSSVLGGLEKSGVLVRANAPEPTSRQ